MFQNLQNMKGDKDHEEDSKGRRGKETGRYDYLPLSGLKAVGGYTPPLLFIQWCRIRQKQWSSKRKRRMHIQKEEDKKDVDLKTQEADILMCLVNGEVP